MSWAMTAAYRRSISSMLRALSCSTTLSSNVDTLACEPLWSWPSFGLLNELTAVVAGLAHCLIGDLGPGTTPGGAGLTAGLTISMSRVRRDVCAFRRRRLPTKIMRSAETATQTM
jgi:hypothetical protein